ncbi:MAG: M24 family metallopeptidase [Acidobacteriota bacterium]|nr:M24 family metallopeptidase [Acidobacteriota bacterium]
MESGEAADTGIDLLSPKDLGVEEARREAHSEGVLWGIVLGRGLELSGVVPGKIALAGHAPAGVLLEAARGLEAAGWVLVDGREISLTERKSKGNLELDAVRHAAAGTCAAFQAVAALLADCETSRAGALAIEGSPLTTGRVRREISQKLAEFGLEQPEGNIVAAGAAAGVPHNQGDSARELRAGEALIVDLFPKKHVFADCTRTFCVGEPSEALAAAHLTVREALARGHASAVAGVSGWQLQRDVCRHFDEAGHATPTSSPLTNHGFVHGLGHGVGFDIHEYPSFRAKAGDEGVLRVGDVFTLEPGLYYPDHPSGGFGVRLEDLVVMTVDGPENLTPLPHDLDPRDWKMGT